MAPHFLRGDVSPDGELNLTDAIRILTCGFVGGVDIPCLDAADVNDDGAINVTDAIVHLSFQFVGGIKPAAPYPGCGPDPAVDDDFPCQSYPLCE